ncbi:beta-ketoacyl-ACP synthase III [Legionella oakridgensis]|uniref:3-oxoacyl-[acyl-carrier-protein] synthase III n=2 Tax=Legionella oakridgensis TaxID=29423 RepID=W0BFL2_9GAMM|nr:beta-ketoacyl-ACP synthase III [Legionella oakridgensis]AHE67412.1 3-oxoacyl-[acyl-carrier-protein] synthase III [Legionella oakridgensis ATCC 33761 = DSM 21215]ETO92946.1 3-oxoacyl-[acyl-carrier-protein] synthase III [Legionella oakridgensis RV-2-2007]KTD43474.1 3-oxoacyl-ACP synthase [Legionella oakridgensis]STY20466.1 chalcone and stilbene synthase [Legionella longbeachae]
MPAVKITGMGQYLPVNKILSVELDQKLGLARGSVEKKSGLVSRHFAQEHETTSFMAAQAALAAIKQAKIELFELDAIIGACGAGEQLLPCSAALIQKKLGLEQSGIPCFDINSTCLSFLTALDTASYLIAGGRFKRVLIVASDIPSAGLNWQDMESCTIFGDGAAACILEQSDGSSRILASHMRTYSAGASFCQVEAGGTRIPPASDYDRKYGLFAMDGKKVFKLATHLVVELHECLLSQIGVTLADIDWVVPHQASMLAMHHLRKRLNISEEKFVDIYATHGNQMAASIPSAFYHLVQTGKIQRGQLVYLLGTGAGLSAAGMILEY